MPARTPAITVAAERVGQFILIIRRQRVLLDEDLAALYGVETRSLVQAVKRNPERFPPDFMFELSAAEWAALRSQTVTSKPGRGGRRYAPYAFTEQGVAMLSSVLVKILWSMQMKLLIFRVGINISFGEITMLECSNYMTMNYNDWDWFPVKWICIH